MDFRFPEIFALNPDVVLYCDTGFKFVICLCSAKTTCITRWTYLSFGANVSHTGLIPLAHASNVLWAYENLFVVVTFWRRDLCCRRTTSLEQSAAQSQCGLSYGQLRRLLKTFLFGQWGHGAVWTVFNCAE